MPCVCLVLFCVMLCVVLADVLAGILHGVLGCGICCVIGCGVVAGVQYVVLSSACGMWSCQVCVVCYSVLCEFLCFCVLSV